MSNCEHKIEIGNNSVAQNSIRIVGEFADDQHCLNVTDRGFKIFNGEE